jgi:integrase
MPKLTKTYVDRLQPREHRYEVGCDSLRGFVVRVNVNGTKTAVVRYFRDGRPRRFKLGTIGEHFPVDAARAEAARILRTVERGNDPARDRELRRGAATFAEVAERYMAEVARPYRKASTVYSYESIIRRHLAPSLGPLRIEEIERADVLRLHQQIGRTSPGAANRVIALVSVIMTNAETWGYRPLRSNPCHRMPKFAGRKMERFLSGEERARLEEVLAIAERAPKGHPDYVSPGAITAIRLLAMTGARCGEIVGLEWSMVRLEPGPMPERIELPDSKTGAKIIPLSPAAVELLRTLERGRAEADGDGEDTRPPWVCLGERGGPVHNIKRAWESIRTRAGLEDVRLHDLRHSAASDMAAAGLSLPIIGHVLGHKNPQTTARYTHLADHARHEAARIMGEQIERSTREGAERLREKRERAQLAAGAEHGKGEASEGGGGTVVPMGGGNVIRFPGGKRRG